ncbi:MAG: hypothetical protein QF909_04205 [SAR202 cluster bacterium]|nr:hypothetical protein [SAR202 cluster bacterium]MDP7224399.1 hypothetical protein [SAR202 cluster bacterium]
MTRLRLPCSALQGSRQGHGIEWSPETVREHEVVVLIGAAENKPVFHLPDFVFAKDLSGPIIEVNDPSPRSRLGRFENQAQLGGPDERCGDCNLLPDQVHITPVES